ncbi:MAG: aryl-sulfate sulfotransferase [Heyndrickxia sp.]
MKKVILVIIGVVIIGLAVNQIFGSKLSIEQVKSKLKAAIYTSSDKNAKTNIQTGIDTNILNAQKKIESDILKESEGSTLDNPYIKLDPFGNSPLSAVVIFDTKSASKVSFTVKGKDSSVDIKDTIDKYETHHEIPILGLYPDANNTVEIASTSKSGEVTSKTITFQTGKLPKYIPTVTIKKADTEKMEIVQNGLTFTVPSTKYPIGFDTNGDIRWYSSRYNSHVFKLLKNGHLLFLSKDSNSGNAYNRLFEMDFAGKVYNVYKLSQTNSMSETSDIEKTLVHHDAIELPSGNLLLTVSDGGGKYVEDTMIEIDRKTGKIVKTIDLKDILPKSFYQNYNSTKRDDGLIDWFHQNALVYDDKDNSIIISGRNQDMVMKLDYKTNKIVWILADPTGWPKEYQKYLINGVGGNFKYTGGQHAPIILPESATDNNKDTVDLLLFDNNVVVTRGNQQLSKKYSAGSQYRINEKTKTAELVWTYGAGRGTSLFSNIIGSDRFMPNTGNRLVDFGWLDSGTKSDIVEVTNDDQPKVAFEAVLSDFPTGAWAYRAERFSLYPDNWVFKVSDEIN